MSFAAELAKRVRRIQFEDLSDEVLHWATVGLIDYTGVTLAGSLEPSGRIVERVVDGDAQPGPSLIFGRHTRTTPLNAALINGTASHAQDFDDCSNTLGGHPSAPILPSVIAIGEKLGSTGRDALLAYVVGYETETRIARGVHFHHYEKGWHPTATLGVFGATAACGRLLDLDEETMATAFSLAVSLSSGVKSNFGTMTKPFHVGHCARHGLFAAMMAREGFTASPEAFEHKQGFFEVFNGEGTYSMEKVLENWGEPFDIVDPGIAVKQYPCCGSTHPAVDAMINLVERESLTPEQVRRVDSWTHPRRLQHTNRPDPQSPLDAKFSVQYVVARALMHGKVVLEHFDDSAYLDAEVRKVMQHVEAAPHPDMPVGSDNHLGAEIRVETVDGRILSERVAQARGRGAVDPLPAEKLREKFRNCAARVLPASRIAPLLDSIEDFANVPNLRVFTDLVAVAPDASGAAAD